MRESQRSNAATHNAKGPERLLVHMSNSRLEKNDEWLIACFHNSDGSALRLAGTVFPDSRSLIVASRVAVNSLSSLLSALISCRYLDGHDANSHTRSMPPCWLRTQTVHGGHTHCQKSAPLTLARSRPTGRPSGRSDCAAACHLECRFCSLGSLSQPQGSTASTATCRGSP